MSESIVSLIVAAVGAVSGLAGAFIGGRAAKQGAEHSVRGMIGQVREQAKHDHSKWLREQRFTSCSRLYEALVQMMQAVHAEQERQLAGPSPARLRAFLSDSEALKQAVFTAYTEVVLVSSGKLAEATSDVYGAVDRLFRSVATPEWDASWRRFGDAFIAFRVEASKIIQGAA
ncbi:hypothetical protein AB0M94_37370 [Streptomyces xanthochromogenes]|uniref:Uncharacterized protein n=1 Tax=Streptomyces xanthochromogenes TaxID=67384 RepID=A0ABQ3B0I2_9ACTN|nr:hypothetical protein [Streptomyces xanthochromogenes]GGY69799.1 hypothetical protein GCM10010326_75090 [Streptomyces xanthochromogenes]